MALSHLLDTILPQLLTEAAHGGLKPSPTGRLRRVLLHLSYSMALSHLLDTTLPRVLAGGDCQRSPWLSVEGGDRRELPAAAEQQRGRCPVEPDIPQDAIAIALDFEGEAGARAPAADPRIHVARAPVVRRDRIRPIAVSAVHQRQITATQHPVFEEIEPVAAADIRRCRGGNLHRSLRSAPLGAPHSGIGPVTGFCALDGKGDPVEVGVPR